jgi:DNA-binding XRE family transcriptional regulator
MELGLRQRKFASRLKANPWTYLFGEHDRTLPTARFIPRALKFLGHDPFPEGATFGGQVRTARRRLGLTQKELGQRIGLSEETIHDLERGR